MNLRCHFYLVFCIHIFSTKLCFAQNRVERPLQIHANFSGLLLDIAGNEIADATVDDLNVNSWTPGLSLGYHINRYFYIGYSLYAPLDLTLKESWGLTSRALDADIILEHQTGIVNNLEVQFSPFKFGIYASFGYSNIGKVVYQMNFKRKGEQVFIGENSYATDLDIRWNSKNINTAAIGLGYTFVSKTGLSFNLGISFPLSFPNDENIRLIPSDPSISISPSDIAFGEQQIEAETFYGPVVMYLNVGYNFKKFWGKNFKK